MLSDPLISDLYAAAAGRLDWQQPLSSLAAQLDLWAVQVIGVDKRSGALIFSGEGGPATPQAALDQFAHPMLLVDEARRIRHVNPLAQAWLNSQDVVSERHGFLHCHHPENQERLARGIDAMQLGGNGGEARREAVVLRRRDGARILAFVTRMDATQTMGMFGQQSCALILLHAPQASKAPLDVFIVAECFGLTPAEAKVAVQIASGFALKEIAQRSRIALPTVRSHLQRAMEKTGTTRQAELVSALLTLPLARASR